MKRLSRRALLRGASGLAFALPFLESLEARAQSAAPRRFVTFFFPNGVFTDQWNPTNVVSETSFTLGPTHAALEPLKQHCLWLSGVNLSVAVTGQGEQHQRGMGALLTGTRIGLGTFVGNDGSRAGWAQGISVDQELVPLLGNGTRVGSLQLGVKTSKRDVSGTLSYSGADQPLLPQNDPALVFSSLFMDSQTDPNGLALLRAHRKSVLDAVLSQFNALRGRLSPSERLRLDEHAARVRELELRVTATPPATGCGPPAPPPMRADGYDSEAAMPDAAQLHLALLELALRCDLTRVATVTVSDAQNHIAMPFLGIASDVHNISHYGDTDPARAALATRDAWVVQRFADFLTALSGIQEAGGTTALDNTLVLLGSELSKGNLHLHSDMPFILAGHGAGFRMGRAVAAGSRPHNDLLLAILQAFGSTRTAFGDPPFNTGPLSGLV